MGYYIMFLGGIVVLLVYIMFLMVSYKLMSDKESMSSYECGFESNSFSRNKFTYRFFLISILFLVFDVEISLMLPVPFLMESVLGIWVFYLFVMVLLVGLMYEYWWGTLNWISFISKA